MGWSILRINHFNKFSDTSLLESEFQKTLLQSQRRHFSPSHVWCFSFCTGLNNNNFKNSNLNLVFSSLFSRDAKGLDLKKKKQPYCTLSIIYFRSLNTFLRIHHLMVKVAFVTVPLRRVINSFFPRLAVSCVKSTTPPC